MRFFLCSLLVYFANYLIYLENFFPENRAALAESNNYDVIVFEAFWRKDAAKTVPLPSAHAHGVRRSFPKKSDQRTSHYGSNESHDHKHGENAL